MTNGDRSRISPFCNYSLVQNPVTSPPVSSSLQEESFPAKRKDGTFTFQGLTDLREKGRKRKSHVGRRHKTRYFCLFIARSRV